MPDDGGMNAMEMKDDAGRLAAFMRFPLFSGLSAQELSGFLEGSSVQAGKSAPTPAPAPPPRPPPAPAPAGG